MTVYFEDEAQVAFDFDVEDKLNSVVGTVRDYVKCPCDVEVSVTIVDKDSIREMNSQFREVDRVTDVLSFPMMEYDAPADFTGEAFVQSKTVSPETDDLMLGDIVLCAQVIKDQAVEYGHSELREMCFLVAHSMLHLFGYDHIEENDRQEMEQKQREIMDILGIQR